MKLLRNHGACVKYHHEEIAYNSRLDEIQAAVLRLKLSHLDAWNEKRRILAAEYNAGLKGLPITLPAEVKGRHHIYHPYSIQSGMSGRSQSLPAGSGNLGRAALSHAAAPFAGDEKFWLKEKDFPVSEQLARQTLSLPLYPFMTADDVRYVA